MTALLIEIEQEKKMDLHTYLENAEKAGRADAMAQSDQLTLGEIISQCEAIAAKEHKRTDDTEPTVSFDFEYLAPTEIDSWRGIYSELALGFKSGVSMRLSEFITMLQEAVGKTFLGYKGGDYTMSRHTPVWVANQGNAGHTAVIDVVDNKYEVILITGYRDAHL